MTDNDPIIESLLSKLIGCGKGGRNVRRGLVAFFAKHSMSKEPYSAEKLHPRNSSIKRRSCAALASDYPRNPPLFENNDVL
jgi:hypothetical protein